MKTIENIEVVELNPTECATINAKGWIRAILVAIGFIIDDWSSFKQGFADGVEAVNGDV